ncbi:MAG: DUF4870 domain-containing protein [Anaerolineales bacterium]|nr:DUF4870 domain-containing protein [Anaerolineales bacterium]
MNSTTDRANNAYIHRKEEQVIAAILHMSTPWGFFALISSGIVWAISKSRSRFLMVQALQAFSFQLISLLAFGGIFLLFGIAFNYAAFSGLIARTGVTEPELTSNLMIAAVVGFAILFFFQFVFPLWGIWAGIQILRGKNYRYPVLGKAIIRYTSRQPFIAKTESSLQNPPTSENEHIIAGLAHVAMLAGCSLFLSPILWATTKKRSQFLNHHLFQASIFQMGVTAILTSSFFVIWGGGMFIGLLQFLGVATTGFFNGIEGLARITFFPFSIGIAFVLFMLISGIYVVRAIVQAFRGKEFNYPFVGKWLLRYMQ